MKNLINGTDFINLCKKNSLGGGYLFFDDEEYMKLHCLGLAKKTILDPDMADFNYQKINCEDDKEWLSTLKDALETPPVFADSKLIVVDELKLRTTAETDEDFFALLSELENYPECTVIFSASKDFDFGRLPKAPSSQYKKLAAHITPVRFERESPARLNTWVAKRFAANGILCDGVTAKYMVDFVSPDMSSLASECEKLICYLKSLGENKVTEELVGKVCRGSSDDELFL